MDALYFLSERTAFIRFFYAQSASSFADVKFRIEGVLPPFDQPQYDDSGEPPYLSEWLEADAALDVLGLACVSMLSDVLKLYLNTLAERVIGFSFNDPKTVRKVGFVPSFFEALGEILDTDWRDCPIDRALIEQIVLARNRAQHGESLTSQAVTHDKATLEKHPRPFFVSETELSLLCSEEGSIASFLMPTIKVDAPALERALAEVEQLAEFIDARLSNASEWRRGNYSENNPRR